MKSFLDGLKNGDILNTVPIGFVYILSIPWNVSIVPPNRSSFIISDNYGSNIIRLGMFHFDHIIFIVLIILKCSPSLQLKSNIKIPYSPIRRIRKILLISPLTIYLNLEFGGKYCTMQLSICCKSNYAVIYWVLLLGIHWVGAIWLAPSTAANN